MEREREEWRIVLPWAYIYIDADTCTFDLSHTHTSLATVLDAAKFTIAHTHTHTVRQMQTEEDYLLPAADEKCRWTDDDLRHLCQLRQPMEILLTISLPAILYHRQSNKLSINRNTHYHTHITAPFLRLAENSRIKKKISTKPESKKKCYMNVENCKKNQRKCTKEKRKLAFFPDAALSR